MTVAAAQGGIQPARPVRHRLSIDRLLPGQVKDLRDAFAAMKKLKKSDSRSYLRHAGIHGLPMPFSCKHNSNIFLPWHRAYLYFFELDLLDRASDPNFALPWWNWTSGRSHEKGLPAAYTKKSGNPLVSADVDPVALQQAADQGVVFSKKTERAPGAPADLPTSERIKQILALGDFLDFQQQLEDVHGEVHGWVGGHMQEVAVAAYDPIFWSHHAMIDRLWRLWQVKHPGAGVPAHLRNRALDPFPMTVAQTINMTSLGYDYAATRARPTA